MAKRKTKTQPQLQTVTMNLAPVIRHDMMEGRNYVVAPMVMITEGVHNGSAGALYYSADELSKTPEVWNHKPVVVYHPQINGQGCSACDPDILTNQKIGVIMNTFFDDGKLKAEAWLEESRIAEVDPRIAENLETGQMMELSTGLFTDHENVDGTWNGEEYTVAVKNCRPDHLALLPDKIGACSIADGAGFLRLNEEGHLDDEKTFKALKPKDQLAIISNLQVLNQMSYDNTRSALSRKKNANDGPYVYIEDVYDGFFIFEMENVLYRQTYTVEEDVVSLLAEVQEVVRVTEYRTLDGLYVGNNEPQAVTINQGKDSVMNRDKQIEALIANGVWAEEDRELLTNMSDEQFKKLTAVSPTEIAENEEAAAAAAAVENEEAPAETPDDYVAKAPPEFRDMLSYGLQNHRVERTALVTKILNNERNVFTKEQLNTKDFIELKGIAALCQPKATENSVDYSAQGDALNVATSNEVTEEPLPVPQWNW